MKGWDGVRELVALASSLGPEPAPEPGPEADHLSRRTLFKLVGASAAVAAIPGCSSRPAREIRPYVHQPELTPGVPQYFATALVEDSFATGVVAETHEGRPTKLEGNPDHPASLGATRAIEQAAVLTLYDPQRAGMITDRGLPATWQVIERWLADRGDRTQLILEPTTSPIVSALVDRVRARFPGVGITFWSPLALRASLAGNRQAFGRPLQTQLDLRRADTIVALEADLIGDHPMGVAYARQLADRRRVVDARSAMSRLYVVEPAYTTTGMLADHRFAVRGVEIERVGLELLAELADLAPGGMAPLPRARGERARWIAALARDLVRGGARSVVVAGERQSAALHAIVAAINGALRSRVVSYTEPVAFEAGGPSHELAGLAQAIARGDTSAFVVLGGNPVYTMPGGVELARALESVPSLYLGLHANETAQACRYLVPAQHALELWDLARAFDGTLTPIQPLIEPLFDGRSIADLLEAMLGDPRRPRDRVRDQLGDGFEAALARGCVGDPAPPVDVTALAPVPIARELPAIELDLRPHPMVHDGRYTNNPWLLELPEPITKLTWDNAAQVSPATAARLGLETGDLVALIAGEHALDDVPVIVVPGHADDSLTLHLGFGREGGEAIARGIGANAFRLWSGPFQSAVAVSPRGGHRELAITQGHWDMEHRPIALAATLGELATEPLIAELARHRGDVPSLLAKVATTGEQWAMSIDLTSCSGCSACVMACAAENNTPVVGRAQVLKSREMHWLRIDRYVEDDVIAVQPMLCQHCEAAPCETVCPVEATTHSEDGINEMTYNRCVGTRFCSNNCPYKVRRFNWFDFKQHDGLQLLARNPDVTVRDRGVMEKCTYCVQRVRRAEIDARVERRPIGEVRTACQQACPTQAIAFGSITRPASSVSEQRHRPHSYVVLHDQGTRPRTTYLARIRNPNPELG